MWWHTCLLSSARNESSKDVHLWLLLYNDSIVFLFSVFSYWIQIFTCITFSSSVKCSNTFLYWIISCRFKERERERDQNLEINSHSSTKISTLIFLLGIQWEVEGSYEPHSLRMWVNISKWFPIPMVVEIVWWLYVHLPMQSVPSYMYIINVWFSL